MRSLRHRTAVAAGVAALAVLAAGCGGSSKSTTTTAAATTTTAGSALKVGLVTDIGGLNDRGFNHLAYLGLQAAHTKLGVQTRVLESHSNADYIPNMSSLAQQGYNLVIGVGFLMDDAVQTMAKKYPNTNFRIVD